MSSTRYNNHHGYDGDSIDNGSSGGGVSNGLLNPFKATKKFFKTTLPGRLHSKLLASNVVESNEIPTTSISSERPCIDASYSLELPDDDQDYQYDNYQYNQDIANQDATNSCIIANNDSDSAPSIMKLSMLTDDAMNDSGLSRSISSNESQKTSYGDFRSWNDVFNHLKREMAYMRQRDAQILADLQFVELELRNVKNHQTMIKSNYAIRNNNNNNNRISINNNNDGHIFDKRQIKLGDLVESIPL
ncbi:hypothetical protein DINM_004725 [Dirofilaria immitis]|nr:hypothetical protein [Dirofilaria immitis]